MVRPDGASGAGEPEEGNLSAYRGEIRGCRRAAPPARRRGQNDRRPDEPGGGDLDRRGRARSQNAGPRLIIQYPLTPGRCRGKA